ncbi:MAG TPA: PDZ domain-containing protein [Flavobacterium sp.]|jgi:hypothetical protein|nr:PDZ domain-containing protein [Flavobacterium sp.]HRZ32040.1 PDZ domain-containing protein [Flavobacterium sp.]HRZ74201.1 PDZ domain-containing protein [Flavobacterium sp.]
MKIQKIIFLLLFFSIGVFGQSSFQFISDKDKIKIPFQFINNLIFVPIQVNGVELTFLLDTGVEETILFSLLDKDQVEFNNVEKIKLKGLGNAEFIEGLKSSKNKIVVTPTFFDPSHTIYIILNEDINISSGVGIPVNGIMGYGFFKDYPMEIDYVNHYITVYKHKSKAVIKKYKKFKKYPIILENNKPYIETKFAIDTTFIEAKLLIDLGNSDAVWLFQNKLKSFELPEPNFSDFLGQGFSGPIFGKRAKLAKFSLGEFVFENPIVAFPDSLSTQSVKLVKNRVGSIGAEILKRFTLFIDYRNSEIAIRKNRNFSVPFNYNMSGLEIHHIGLKWIPEKIQFNKSQLIQSTESVGFYYKFVLKPIYVISNVREDSPAAECGLKKEDIIVSINKKEAHLLSLQEINNLLKSEEGKLIKMEVQRGSQFLNFSFVLKSIL